MPGVRRTLATETGFTLVDAIVAMCLFGILTAIAVPSIMDISNAMALGHAQRMVESELQQARLRAVTSNRVMRVRFNCPLTKYFRMVELIGTTSAPVAADTAGNRCSTEPYPFPASDNNPLTLPNQDGVLRKLDDKVEFGAVQTIEFWPNGAAHSVNADGTSGPVLPGEGVDITVTKGAVVKAVTVNGLGRVHGN